MNVGQCRECGKEFEPTKGRQVYCCSQCRNLAYAEKNRENVRQWQLRNPERVRENKCRWYRQHLDKTKERSKESARRQRQKDPETYKKKQRESARLYRQRHPKKVEQKRRNRLKCPGNPEKRRERIQRYRMNSPEKDRARRQRYYLKNRDKIKARTLEMYYRRRANKLALEFLQLQPILKEKLNGQPVEPASRGQ
jgi:hypothetical protein